MLTSTTFSYAAFTHPGLSDPSAVQSQSMSVYLKREHSFSPSDISSMDRRNGAILRSTKVPVETLGYLESYLNPSQLRAVVSRHPWILGISYENNIVPKHSYLMVKLALPPKSMTLLLLHHTTVFALSLRNRILPTLEGIKEDLNLEDEQLSKLMSRHPGVVLLRADNLRDKLNFFKQRYGVEVSRFIDWQREHLDFMNLFGVIGWFVLGLVACRGGL